MLTKKGKYKYLVRAVNEMAKGEEYLLIYNEMTISRNGIVRE